MTGSPRRGFLFVDTFTNYFEPENAHAATKVLRAAGARVAVAGADGTDREPRRPLCCGRTYLAAGLVDEAEAKARRTVAQRCRPTCRARRRRRGARAVVPAVDARRVSRDGPWRRRAAARG